MRAYFFLCITFFSLSSAMAQLNPFLPAKAVLKTGDTLNNIVGKYKANKTFVYKSDSDKKAIKIDFFQTGIGSNYKFKGYHRHILLF